MILCLGTTPSMQRVMVFDSLIIDAVNRTAQVHEGAAGKSVNTAKVLAALGERVVATGFLGGDRGEFIRETLERQGVDAEFVSVQPRTRLCVTVIDSAANTHTELVEESSPVDVRRYGDLGVLFDKLLVHATGVALSGTLTKGGPPEFYHECVLHAHRRGVISVLDAQGAPLMHALAAKPTVVKPNRAELAATLGVTLASTQDAMTAMRQLVEKGAGGVVITMGRDGALAFDGTKGWRVTGPTLRAVNPIGSGDAFTAGLISAMLRGTPLAESCRLGAACGAANALTLLAGQVDPAEVRRIHADVKVEELPA
jgi:tagatose 6-phosphate kinase